MWKLAVANLWHRKLRTGLSVAVVAVGVLMLVTIVSLSRGSVDEVRRRFESVEAELVLTPENFAPLEGEAQLVFGEGRAAKIAAEARWPNGEAIVAAVVPVMIDEVTMAGQRQRVFGIHPDQWAVFAGGRSVLAGQPLSDELGATLRSRGLANQQFDESDVGGAALAAGRQLLIDERLARAGFRDPTTGAKRPYRVGDRVRWLGGQDWTIVGVVETGVAGRAFAPIETLRHYRNSAEGATLLFVKIADPAREEEAETALREYLTAGHFGLEVTPKNAYGRALQESLRSLLLFTDVVAGLSVAVSFLVVLLTVYTMVVERTHEIAILRSLGATRRQVLGEILLEAAMISAAGLLAGIGLSLVAAWGIQTAMPLLTVEIRTAWLAVATIVAMLGGVLAALPAAWWAASRDPAEALSQA